MLVADEWSPWINRKTIKFNLGQALFRAADGRKVRPAKK
jgi:hypothetical protein